MTEVFGNGAYKLTKAQAAHLLEQTFTRRSVPFCFLERNQEVPVRAVSGCSVSRSGVKSRA
jgi:hypothetical protein